MNKKSLFIAISIALFSVLALGALAFTANSYALNWWTLDSGSGTSSSASYTLNGSAGQPDAGISLTGGNYSLVGGFWVNNNRYNYLPLIRR